MWAPIISISLAVMTVMFSADWEMGFGVPGGGDHQVVRLVVHAEGLQVLVGRGHGRSLEGGEKEERGSEYEEYFYERYRASLSYLIDTDSDQ